MPSPASSKRAPDLPPGHIVSETKVPPSLEEVLTATQDINRHIILNLCSLAGLGVSFSLWVFLCTDSFPLIGSLLSLGGIFAWIAFLSGVVHEDRKKQIQKSFEDAFLAKRRVRVFATLLAFLFLAIISCFGTIELRSLGAEQFRVLEVLPAVESEKKDGGWVLLPSARARKLVYTGWRHRPYRVRIEGLPVQTVIVKPIWPTPITVPGSFKDRWTILVLPVARFTESAENDPRFALVVAKHGQVIGIIPTGQYRGESVWVGCHADVRLPDWMVDRWAAAGRIPALWRRPLSLAEGKIFASGDYIEAWILHNVDSLKLGSEISPNSPHLYRDNIFAQGRGTITSALGGRESILEIELTP